MNWFKATFTWLGFFTGLGFFASGLALLAVAGTKYFGSPQDAVGAVQALSQAVGFFTAALTAWGVIHQQRVLYAKLHDVHVGKPPEA